MSQFSHLPSSSIRRSTLESTSPTTYKRIKPKVWKPLIRSDDRSYIHFDWQIPKIPLANSIKFLLHCSVTPWHIFHHDGPLLSMNHTTLNPKIPLVLCSNFLTYIPACDGEKHGNKCSHLPEQILCTRAPKWILQNSDEMCSGELFSQTCDWKKNQTFPQYL